MATSKHVRLLSTSKTDGLGADTRCTHVFFEYESAQHGVEADDCRLPRHAVSDVPAPRLDVASFARGAA